MYEDWRIEVEAFPAGSSVFCIASAGCTALALASRGHAVTAIDINPAQVEYVRERLQGAPPREGSAERMLGLGRRLLPAVGWSAERRRHFLTLDDPAEQLRYWDGVLETARMRVFLLGVLEPSLLRLFFKNALLRALPARFGDELRRRLRRGFSRHGNRQNPYAWGLLLGEVPKTAPDVGRPAAQIELACADAVDYLERCRAGRFNAFTLSNIFDGADGVFAQRLWSAVRHAAAPGAIVVVRSFGMPGHFDEEERAGLDRGMLWGRVSVIPAASAPVS
jgi:S-adenosylmethionine:diacylglycerol 3-amino-3-carboxypropyl transferase